MTASEIQYVIRQFIDAAIRAGRAGFDGLQIHAAHFFFLSRFISPAVNHRTDAYGGLDEAESLAICRLLDEAGIDSIEISGNGTSVGGIKPHINEGYFAPFAAKAANNVSCPVIVVGGFRSLDTMEDVLNKTSIELISLSRPLLREPELPNKMKADPSVISKCVSCNACYKSPSHKCVFRGRD